MITTYAPDEKQIVDYSSIIEAAFLKLRKELRIDLNQIVSIEWNTEPPFSSEEDKQIELAEDSLNR